jgi:hypothetical protein
MWSLFFLHLLKFFSYCEFFLSCISRAELATGTENLPSFLVVFAADIGHRSQDG